jgi:hypothetical protein
MITRLHISSFIALTIAVWLLALWMQGMPVISVNFIKPFGTVVGIITFVSVVFNKYLWSWKIFKGWYVKRPDLRGSWEVELKSSWINEETGEVVEPIMGYAVIRQTLTSLSLRLMTKESRSVLITYNIEQQEDDELFKLVGVYRNEPKIELQGVRSEIHHGSFLVEIHGNPVYEMQGHYWTDRGTKGSLKIFNKQSKLYDTFEQARKLHPPEQ